MNYNQLNTTGLNLSDPQTVAEMVEVAKQMQAALDSFWLYIKSEMQKRGTDKIEGEWGNIRFDIIEVLRATDLNQVDDAFVKPALDTKEVKHYRNKSGILPAGVTSNTTLKFVRDINRSKVTA